MSNIRNFSIIAHIDHGKSTLADRLIEICGGLSKREMSAQVLDSMDIERERGITIKAQCVTLSYKQDGIEYAFNIIDTPGHVDFAYEVARSLSACEGALLVVDAAQGVEAQTVAVCYSAIEQGLEIIPVLNKVDLPQADIEKVKGEIEEIIGVDTTDAICVSAKSGVGIDDLLRAIVDRIPAPKVNQNKRLKALIIDSWFDAYLGVISLVKIVSGKLSIKDKVRILSTDKVHVIEKLGVFKPKPHYQNELEEGYVGFIISGIKEISGAPVGDTIIMSNEKDLSPLPGFKKVKPQVYAGLYTVESTQYELFRDALAKLSLNDSSLFYEHESSDALGFGFRCGFLGMLHMEIIQERLEREYNLDLIITAPTVIYEITKEDGSIIKIDNPSEMNDRSKIKEIREPIVDVNIITPHEYLGSIIQLCIERRGVQKNILYSGNQVILGYEIPMSEVILDFHDKLKSVSRGFASLDYTILKYNPSNLVKLDILLNNEKVDPLSVIIHKDSSVYKGRAIAEKLKEIIPRQMFDIAIQAAIGSQIIARQTVKAMRKNVTAKCYGGDISRKKKLLEKQKAGKKKMKQIGKVGIPKNAFLAILNLGNK